MSGWRGASAASPAPRPLERARALSRAWSRNVASGLLDVQGSRCSVRTCRVDSPFRILDPQHAILHGHAAGRIARAVSRDCAGTGAPEAAVTLEPLMWRS